MSDRGENGKMRHKIVMYRQDRGGEGENVDGQCDPSSGARLAGGENGDDNARLSCTGGRKEGEKGGRGEGGEENWTSSMTHLEDVWRDRAEKRGNEKIYISYGFRDVFLYYQ